MRIALASLAPALLAAAPAAPPAQSPGELAASMDRKLDAIVRGETEDSVQVTDAELSAFLNGSPESFELPPGLSDVAVTFEPGGLRARGWVELGRLEGLPESVARFASGFGLLGGAGAWVEVEGRFHAASGFGRLDLEQVSVASVRVPIEKVVELVSSSTRSRRYPHGFDLRTPFRLPGSLKRVELREGAALLGF